jgi:3-isopropylmalate/(R)-2-methylmalate dehydratase small subunit
MTAAQLRGRVHTLGDDIDTDQIIAAHRCHSSDDAMLGRYVFENLDPALRGTFSDGDLIFAGQNFGGGSAREQAPLAIKGAGIACVVATNFARTFYRNAVNVALPILIAPDAVEAAKDGDIASVDLDRGTIEINGLTFQTEPFPAFVKELIAHGGLVNYVRARLEERARSE